MAMHESKQIQPEEASCSLISSERIPIAPAPPPSSAYSSSLKSLPDELFLRLLYFLEIDDLLAASRTCHHLRSLSLDTQLHKWRLWYSYSRLESLLLSRPPLHSLQTPTSTIYLSKTHLAARRLHWSLVSIRLNRSLLRRPNPSSLVKANILPKECCKSGVIWGLGPMVFAQKRRVEIEKIKEGLRVWLERKAREIHNRPGREGGVGVLVWRFSRRMGGADARDGCLERQRQRPKKDRVSSLRRFFESLAAVDWEAK